MSGLRRGRRHAENGQVPGTARLGFHLTAYKRTTCPNFPVQQVGSEHPIFCENAVIGSRHTPEKEGPPGPIPSSGRHGHSGHPPGRLTLTAFPASTSPTSILSSFCGEAPGPGGGRTPPPLVHPRCTLRPRARPTEAAKPASLRGRPC